MATPTDAFTLTRTFDAPRALVFKVLSSAEHMARWWGPAGWNWVKGELDFRPGGRFHYGMAMPGGPQMWGLFTYEDIVAPEKIVFRNAFSNEAGELVRHPMAPTWPLEVRNVLTLQEKDGQTMLTLMGAPYEASLIEQQTFTAGFESMRMGFGGTFDQLGAYLAELSPPAQA
jgi:uncharacterized protein YndB with AHSA1/START domain